MNIPRRLSVLQSDAEKRLYDLMQSSDLPAEEKLHNLAVYADPILMSRLLFLNFIYQKIITVQGVILDLGTGWGQNAIVFQTLRSIYEPYNYQRKVIAFDTFDEFVGLNETENHFANIKTTTPNYQSKLETLMQTHEDLHPLSHIKKFSVVVGDVTTTLPKYFSQHPSSIVALAYFDLDIYQPTYTCINSLQNRLTKGSVLVFDELNYESSAGETQAVMDAIGLRNISIKKFPYCSRVSYTVID